MDAPEADAGRARIRRLVVILAALVVVAAALLLSQAAHPPARRRAVVIEGGEPGENDVARALRLAGVDSTKKNEWVEAVPGIDEAGLSPEQRELFVRFANAERCTCGCGFTLAACRRFDSSCEVSLPRVEALLDSVRRGLLADASGLRERPPATRR